MSVYALGLLQHFPSSAVLGQALFQSHRLSCGIVPHYVSLAIYVIFLSFQLVHKHGLCLNNFSMFLVWIYLPKCTI